MFRLKKKFENDLLSLWIRTKISNHQSWIKSLGHTRADYWKRPTGTCIVPLPPQLFCYTMQTGKERRIRRFQQEKMSMFLLHIENKRKKGFFWHIKAFVTAWMMTHVARSMRTRHLVDLNQLPAVQPRLLTF